MIAENESVEGNIGGIAAALIVIISVGGLASVAGTSKDKWLAYDKSKDAYLSSCLKTGKKLTECQFSWKIKYEAAWERKYHKENGIHIFMTPKFQSMDELRK